MWCCGDAEEDTYGPPASQHPAPPNRNNHGEMSVCLLYYFGLLLVFLFFTVT